MLIRRIQAAMAMNRRVEVILSPLPSLQVERRQCQPICTDVP
jgi:hypothetical protein